MITMEFDDMKKIWDSQSNQPLYAINEQALHHRILSKKESAFHITNWSELMVILVNLAAGATTLAVTLSHPSGSKFMYLLSAWMFLVGVYALISRYRRIRGEKQFDRSILGDLRHAISVSVYQVNFSRIMRLNIVPLCLIAMIALWDKGKSWWALAAVLGSLLLLYYASGWEHNYYVRRRNELQTLEKKMLNEEKPGDAS